jgi:hypothetical protein
MIEGTIVKNGKIRLIITGTDSIDTEILKQLDGATCRLISENYKLGDKSISNGLLIEITPERTPDNPPVKQ